MKRAGLSISLLLVIVLVMWLFAMRHHPSLLPMGGSVEDDHGRMLLNPFRSRAPERTAVEMLRMLRSTDCEDISHRLNVSDASAKQTCQQEQLYPISTWSLEAREDQADSIKLRYRVVRKNGTRDVTDPVWINVMPSAEGWRVASMEAWY